MLQHQHALRVHHEERTRRLRDSARSRRLASRRAPRTLRRRVGRSLVSIGTRMASDPANEPARTR